ncbi:MAG: hypothetical protein D6756_05155 [Cyanobacteria bacterium J083]|nr:MAG: hypothetical protein D6756_05155 [Cyanobacteria bacterium J083]
MSLTKGRYSIDLIKDRYTAWSAWSSDSCTVTTGCSQLVSPIEKGWLNSFAVMSPAISQVEIAGVSIPLTNAEIGSGFALDFFHQGNIFRQMQNTRAFGVADALIYPSAELAFAAARGATFLLEEDTTIGIFLTDGPDLSAFADNRGGLSLDISFIPDNSSQKVPEPNNLLSVAAIGITLGLKRLVS